MNLRASPFLKRICKEFRFLSS